MLATLLVNSVLDDWALPQDDGVLTLREAIAYVNQSSQPEIFDSQQITGTLGDNDQIVFAPSLYNAVPATIELEHGELWVRHSVAILGPGYELLTIDASLQPNNSDSFLGDGAGVFRIARGFGDPSIGDLTLSGMTITGGDSIGGGGIQAFAGAGDNYEFRGLRIMGNSALNRGGGVALDAGGTGSILLEDSLVIDNHLSPLGTGLSSDPYLDVTNYGAGIAADVNGGGTIEVNRVDSSNNVSEYINSLGGGLGVLSVEGTIRVSDSLFSENRVGRPQSLEEFFGDANYFDQQNATVGLGGNGGGIGIARSSSISFPSPVDPVAGDLEFLGVSIVDNTAYGGGGGFFHGLYDYLPNFDLVNSLVYGNRASYGGGVHGSNGAIRHSTIASNKAGFGGTAGIDAYGGGVVFDWMTYVGNIINPGSNTIGVTLDHTIVYGNEIDASPATYTVNGDPLQETFIFGTEVALDGLSGAWVYTSPPNSQDRFASATIPGSHSIIGSLAVPERMMAQSLTFPPEAPDYTFTLNPPANSSSSNPGLASGLSNDSAIQFLDGSFLPVLPILAGGAAVNAGSFALPNYPTAAGEPILTDLRGPGYNRIVGSAIDIGSFEFGAGPDPVATAPRVEDVIFVRPSTNGGPPLSMEAQVAAEKQLNSLNLAGVNQIRIVFDRPIDNFQADDLKLRALALGPSASQVSAVSVVADPDGRAATWLLSAALPRNVFALRLEDRLASGGVALNGEWTNANTSNQASGLPTLRSGDGDVGGDFVFAFVNFPGDFNSTYNIDLLDLDILGANWGTGSTHSTGDANGDGVVDLLDLDILGANFGTSLGFNTLRNLLIASVTNYNGSMTGDIVDQLDEAIFNQAGAGTDLDGDGDFADLADRAIFEWYRDLEVVV